MLIRESCFCSIGLIWILTIFSHASGLQKFLETPSSSEVSPGKDILLACKIQNRRGACSWQKDSKPVGTYAGKYEWAGGAAGGTAGGQDCSLWVRAASLQLDDGLWQCQVTASSYDVQDALSSPAVPLSVHVPPQPPRIMLDGAPLAPGRPLPAAQGKRTSVLCEARYGNPPAAISWYLDDDQLSAWSQTNSSETERPRVWAARSALELVGARSSHGRVLACRAAHPAYPSPGYKVATATLDVTFPPIAHITGVDDLGAVEEGGRALSLRCMAEGNPAPSAWWVRSASMTPPPTNPADTLLLAPVARNHSGTYTCHAKNSMGESDPVSIEIDVRYAAHVVWVGPEPAVQSSLFSRVVLECRAEGNPPPRYLWTHLPLEAAGSDIGGGMPVGRDSQLVLPNVSYHQQGSYRCTAANNIAGRERWHAADPISLVVVGPPVGEGPGSGGPAEARLGADARVSSLVCAEPPPRRASWHWGSLTLSVPAQIGRYRSVEPVKHGACYLYVLNVLSSTRQDGRTYLLRVENERGATAHAAMLVLHDVDFTENAALAPVIGAAIVVAALLLAIFCIIRRCRSTQDKNEYSSSELNEEKIDVEESKSIDRTHSPPRPRVGNPTSIGMAKQNKGIGLPADAVYSTSRVYSPDALKETVDVEKEHVYSILEPRVQYDVTISRLGTPSTHLTVSRPLGAPPLIPVATPEPPGFTRIHKSGRKSGRSSGKSNRTSRPKSLQSFDNPRYLDHLFPSTAEL